MPKYHTTEQVETRLLGKVKFTDSDEEPNRMSRRLLRSLMDEAEGEVERSLSPRYAAPFVTDDGGAFRLLPGTTQQVIQTACKLLSCVKVLETDFGRGTAVKGDNYKSEIEKRYKQIIDKELKRREDEQRFFYPPLTSLKLSYQNDPGDTGFSGYISLTSRGVGDFPAAQINDPQETFWNGTLTQLDNDDQC